ncbi:hypothetical protein Tco_1360834 [Tanacetum coccineum]
MFNVGELTMNYGEISAISVALPLIVAQSLAMKRLLLMWWMIKGASDLYLGGATSTEMYLQPWQVCSFMLCDLDFEPLSLSLSSMPSCDLVSFFLCQIAHTMPYLERFKSELAKSLSLNLELS